MKEHSRSPTARLVIPLHCKGLLLSDPKGHRFESQARSDPYKSMKYVTSFH